MNTKPLLAPLKENGRDKKISITYNFGEFKDQLASLKERFSRLADGLEKFAQEIKNPGRISAENLMGEIEDCQKCFLDLRGKVFEVGNSLDIPDKPDLDKVASLNDLESMVNLLADFEDKRKTYEEVKNRLLMILDRVALIVHRDNIDFQPLSECRAKANELRQTIEASSWPELHRNLDALTNSSQLFSDLLTLVESSSELDDTRWGLVHDSVEQNFGKILAVAASRGKLIVSTEIALPKVLPPNREKKPNPPVPSAMPALAPEIIASKAELPKVKFGVESAKREIKYRPRISGIEDKSEAIFDFIKKLTNTLQDKKKL